MWYNSPSPSILKSKYHHTHREELKSELDAIMPIDVYLKKSLSSKDRNVNIAECSAYLHSLPDGEQILQFGLDMLLALTEANAGSIFIWDETSKELILRAARGRYLESIPQARMKLREGISGWVAEQGHSILVKNINEDGRMQAIKRLGKYQSLSFISLPILAGSKLVGVINITEKHNLNAFNEDDFDKVSIVAKHVAYAFENLRTEKRLWKENEELSEDVIQLKEKMKQQEPLVSIGKLASNLAHELNNPLDGIRRFLNLALDQLEEGALAKEYLLKAKGGIRRSIQVIRGLLSFSSEASRQIQKTSDLHRVLEEAVQCSQQNPNYAQITFQLDFAPGPVHVKDAGLVTVFQNLFENARHAMDDKGSISIRTIKDDKDVLITVADSGPGIPEHIKARIFEPFFTTKDKGKGTGIGLSICRDIVERASGTVNFESQENKGTTFLIRMPYFHSMD